MKHEIKRDGELLCEGRDVRVFAIRHPEDPARIKAIPIPEDIREMCS
jgi:4-hydroxybenzoyl-CoA thioesterase